MVKDDDTAYLEYELSDGRRAILRFAHIDHRDGCHISLDLYKAYLGPVDEVVLQRVLAKFRGELVQFSS
ncbi:hypothetical protein GCM10010885_17580 [Alicyclobacillus cellulosilyticus]|uniref:Uncharacterized protein n=1 Tax=Alicyclobacillus cellulosilyticus TaxID=1003997 RepID=A0A917KD57_9BACL|nr:hypothetical protein [Alicyclobacillus cellulosilyticus]GGJ08978.1 hypothetical protein GCM10010885_17580 [Alicyclobacillus cellulosilyticus]